MEATNRSHQPHLRMLNVPGHTNSGPEHWQTLWELADTRIGRVRQRNWDRPVRNDWVASLDEHIDRLAPAVLIAHSLGCATVAHWATTHGPRSVRGALLVAPADVDRADFPDEIVGFAPMPLGRLPFASIVVASDDDPFVTVERAQHFARHWGSRFIRVGERGHLNSASGLGAWPEGERILARLLREVAEPSSGGNDALEHRAR